MTIIRREVRLFDAAPITAAGQVVRSSQVSCEGADRVRLLLAVTEIGTAPGDGEITVRPIFVDADGTEYLDGNTTYGTFSLTDAETPCNVSVVIPDPSAFLALKITGAGTLTPSAGFSVSARLVLVGNTGA